MRRTLIGLQAAASQPRPTWLIYYSRASLSASRHRPMVPRRRHGRPRWEARRFSAYMAGARGAARAAEVVCSAKPRHTRYDILYTCRAIATKDASISATVTPCCLAASRRRHYFLSSSRRALSTCRSIPTAAGIARCHGDSSSLAASATRQVAARHALFNDGDAAR